MINLNDVGNTQRRLPKLIGFVPRGAVDVGGEFN